MHPRRRKLIGTVLLLALVVVWVAVAMIGAQHLPSVNGGVAWFFYVVAGLGWILPAMPLIRWMTRGDKPPQRLL